MEKNFVGKVTGSGCKSKETALSQKKAYVNTITYMENYNENSCMTKNTYMVETVPL